MSEREFVRVGLRIIDEQIVDCNGRRCGRVEDLEVTGEIGSSAQITAILCGAIAWKRRLTPSLAQLIPGDPHGLRRVPWDEVTEMHNEIHVAGAESDLQAAAQEDPNGIALSLLFGAPLLNRRDQSLGPVHEVLASRRAGSQAGVPWELEGVLVGRRAQLQRIGFWSTLDREIGEGTMPPNFVPWDGLGEFDHERRVLIATS